MTASRLLFHSKQHAFRYQFRINQNASLVQVLAPCLDEMQRLQDAVEAEDADSDGPKAAEQQLKLYMQVGAKNSAAATVRQSQPALLQPRLQPMA